jgi:hypothetical protein
MSLAGFKVSFRILEVEDEEEANVSQKCSTQNASIQMPKQKNERGALKFTHNMY